MIAVEIYNVIFSQMQFDNLLVPEIWKQVIKVFTIVTGVLIQTSQAIFL